MSANERITDVLRRAGEGESEAFDRLMRLVYHDLRRIARQQLRGHNAQTLDTSALVNEAYLKLADQKAIEFNDRAHFFGIAARAMRQIIVDYARERLAQKRGGDQRRVDLDETRIAAVDDAESLIAVHEALSDLARHDERLVRVVECRFFTGLSEQETAEALGVSTRTVERDWARARAWLGRALKTPP